MRTEHVQKVLKRAHHLRVPVFPNEKIAIEQLASQAGLSVARYLRDVGQGYKISGIVDYEKVRELARINGDLGRLGGLLKLWLSNDARAARFGQETIFALLSKLDARQEELAGVMKSVVRPQSEEKIFSR